MPKIPKSIEKMKAGDLFSISKDIKKLAESKIASELGNNIGVPLTSEFAKLTKKIKGKLDHMNGDYYYIELIIGKSKYFVPMHKSAKSLTFGATIMILDSVNLNKHKIAEFDSFKNNTKVIFRQDARLGQVYYYDYTVKNNGKVEGYICNDDTEYDPVHIGNLSDPDISKKVSKWLNNVLKAIKNLDKLTTNFNKYIDKISKIRLT